MEVCCLLQDLAPVAINGGPLSEQGGVFWIGLSDPALEGAIKRCPLLGYTAAVDLVAPLSTSGHESTHQGQRIEPTTRWRGVWHRLIRLYTEDAEALRAQAPDRRTFLLETSQGDVRSITGYRGDGGPLSRRGLPVLDARLLVNLVFTPDKGTFLDPFAGIGGVVLEAIRSGWRVLSTDIDPTLRHGLRAYGAEHIVANATQLPYVSESVDAIASEPPYDREAESVLGPALREMARVLRPGGRIALLCVPWQAEVLRSIADALGLSAFLDATIDRKGLDVIVLAWRKG